MQSNSNLTENERKILSALTAAKPSFRTHPKDDYLSNLGLALAADFSTREVEHLMAKAARTFDHYPSLAQLLKLAEEIDLKNLFKPKASTFMYREAARTCPWPPGLEGLMLRLEGALKTGDDRGVRFGCAYNKITEEEAMRLYEDYKARIWDSDLANDVILRSRGEDFHSSFLGAVNQRQYKTPVANSRDYV